ncbi:hypothetical protein RGQ15_03045 [Paracoccus sp. MBLB3053]|uniref:DUF2339 domain-containing protein n=1 Tax=Paracoccus aurantius TaxID=3073814 RepID=A0ABU2HPM8_9RHOB|nr:hypothetical protein [Paracoccus sp. MBLB3053]MDS9466554.1 hypothetical protein [Paracoccus sp. MBLB3053]
MIDILLLGGVALCALSVLLAIIAVAQTRAPRGAAVALVLGLVALFAGSLLDSRPLGLDTLAQSWHRLQSGESFYAPIPPEAPAEAPAEAPSEVPAEAPAEAPAESSAEPPAEAPVEAPAETPAPAEGQTGQ